jgi:hypothetical protein
MGSEEERLLRALAYGAPRDLALLKAVQDRAVLEEERARCEGSLLEFLRSAWPHMGRRRS